MSYIINNSRGNVIAVIADGTVNTTATDLALVGRALTSYGTYENENYVYLLENFANSSAPLQPILGQLWYDSATDKLSAYSTANTWAAIASETYVDSKFINSVLTGIPTAPTASIGTSTAQIATTAFVNNALTGNLANVHLIGNSTAITAAIGTATTQIATTAFVVNQLQNSNTIVTSGNITAGNVLTTGIVSAMGNITGDNFITTGNVYAGFILGNVVSPPGGAVSTTGNVSGGNILTSGIVSAAGNITTAQTLYADRVIANTVIANGTSSAFKLPNLTQTQINALTSSNGDMVYNTTAGLPQIYQAGAWKNFTISYYS
jgi:hypothetical protein